MTGSVTDAGHPAHQQDNVVDAPFQRTGQRLDVFAPIAQHDGRTAFGDGGKNI